MPATGFVCGNVNKIYLLTETRYHKGEPLMLESENSKKSTPIAITNQGGSE